MSGSNLKTRLLTSALAAPVLIGLIYLAPEPLWYATVWLVALIGADEFLRMTHGPNRSERLPALLLCAATGPVVYYFSADARILLSALVAVPMLGLLLPLLRVGDVKTAALRALGGAAAPLYLGQLTCLALIRRGLPGYEGPGFVLLTLTIAWMADTGGYFAGRAYGKTKLYEVVSPNKTWEGAAGGILGSVFAALVAHFVYLPSLGLGSALLLAVGGSALSQVGDLCESLLKRSTNVKDSGALLPGHGGMLDRIDGLLFVSPLLYLYVLWQPGLP